MNLTLRLVLVGLVIVGGLYYTYNFNSEDKVTPDEQLTQETIEKVPLYYDIDNPDKVFTYDKHKKEFVEVTVE